MDHIAPVIRPVLPPEGLVCFSEEETQGAGRTMAEALSPGACLSLEGPLGAGKSSFVRGLAAGLGIDPKAVSSPTFTLVHEYAGGRLPLVHMDLYRLRFPSELDALGFDDLLDGTSVLAIEWGNKFPDLLPSGTWRLHFEIENAFRRIRSGGDLP